ncbi:MAG: hypothetical protein M3380_17095 [Chloroflexota bacterium]|nr:hypothetical protein [Chloroflexota bacterium]
MLNAKRLSDRSPSLTQFFLALSIVAVFAFLLGLLASPLARSFVQTPAAVEHTTQSGNVAPARGNQGAGTVSRKTPLVRVPYEAGWELYDGGWAGGPNTSPTGMTGQSGRSHPAPPSVRRLRPEQVLTLPPQIQEEVAGQVVQPAQALAPERILMLPPQIQAEVREATRRGSN